MFMKLKKCKNTSGKKVLFFFLNLNIFQSIEKTNYLNLREEKKT